MNSMELNQERYALHTKGGHVKAYLEKHRSSNEWGSEVECIVCADSLQMPVYIY